MKVFHEVLTDKGLEKVFVCDIPLCLTDDDRMLGEYNTPAATYCQPCGAGVLYDALGLPKDKYCLTNIYVDLSKDKPTVWMNTSIQQVEGEDFLPGDFYTINPTDIELFDLLKQAIFLLATQAADAIEKADFDESLAAAVAGVSVEEHRQQLLAMDYKILAANGHRIH